jgi:hypothetical protein
MCLMTHSASTGLEDWRGENEAHKLGTRNKTIRPTEWQVMGLAPTLGARDSLSYLT